MRFSFSTPGQYKRMICTISGRSGYRATCSQVGPPVSDERPYLLFLQPYYITFVHALPGKNQVRLNERPQVWIWLLDVKSVFYVFALPAQKFLSRSGFIKDTTVDLKEFILDIL